MTKEDIKTEKRILAVLGLALLLIVMASYFTKVSAQDLSQGRIFTRSVMPTGTITNFVANRDILIVNGQQYYYSGGWKPVTLIRGEKGDKGDTGATGANGADGVCPTCPPASGGSGSIGFVDSMWRPEHWNKIDYSVLWKPEQYVWQMGVTPLSQPIVPLVTVVLYLVVIFSLQVIFKLIYGNNMNIAN